MAPYHRSAVSRVLIAAALLTAAPAAAQPPLPEVEKRLPGLVALYQWFHAHPELALQEERTSARLAKELRAAGFDVTERVGGYGVVAVLRNGPGPTVMVRADMDALPIVEETGLPYASKVRTRDRDGLEVGVMHACGHDVNMTCLVGVAQVLNAMKDRLKGTLVFIGQPAEEIGAGARMMLDAGLLTKFPRPDFALALHCDGRYPHGHVNYRMGQLQANVDSVDILVRGKGGHGAAPHVTVDPIVLACRMVLDLQTISSRERNPQEAVVVTVGSFHGGSKHNIIPAEGKLQLTVRTMTDASRKEVLESIARIARAAAEGARAPEPVIRHDANAYTPALVNGPLTKRIVPLLQETLGPDKVHVRAPSAGGEDFSRFTLAGLETFYYHIGSADPAKYAESVKPGGVPLAPTHSAHYAPVAAPTIRTGVLTMSVNVLNLLGRP